MDGSRAGLDARATLRRLQRRFTNFRGAFPGLTRLQILSAIAAKILRGDAYRSLGRELNAVDAYKPLRRSAAELAALKDRPSVVIAALPKSGAQYVISRMAKTYGYRTGRVLGIGEFPDFTVQTWMAEEFGQGGLVTEAPPPSDNEAIQRLCANGLTRVVLYVRDPRAVTYNLIRSPGSLSAIRLSSDAFAAMSHQQQLDHCIDTFLADAVSWLNGWVNLLGARSIDIHLAPYETLLTDETAFFHSLSTFYGLPVDAWPDASAKDRHAAETWRKAISPDRITRMTRMMPDRLFEYFGFER